MQIRDHVGTGKPAVILHPSGTVVTFDEMEARANRLAHYFRKAGLVEGDAVAILMENNAHIHTVMWAARRAGLYYVPINIHLTPAEAAYIVDNSSAKAIIGSAALRKTCENLAEHLPGGLPDVLMIADDDLDGWLRYPECVADQPDTPIDDETRRRSAAVLVGNHRPPQGHQTRTAACASVRGAGHDVRARRILDGSRRRVPEPRPAVPHRAVGVVDDDALRAACTVVVLEKFDAEGCLDAIAAAPVSRTGSSSR